MKFFFTQGAIGERGRLAHIITIIIKSNQEKNEYFW